MAYGGPDSLEEIPGYLADIRAGRPTPSAIVEEITENYRAIGGRSPLLEISRRQVDALAEELGDGFRCYLGMRHWSPWIEEAVGRMIEDGITRVVGLVLAPQFSALSVARYQQKVADGLDLYRGRIEFEQVPSYHDAPGLIEALAARVSEGMSHWPETERDLIHVVFTAHSLPERILAEGDPYREELLQTARLIAERAALESWSFAFQSASPTGEPWLGPNILDELTALHERGVEGVLVCPIGFVSDHLEILWDIDIEAAERAAELGMELDRIESLNDDPAFIRGLADLVSVPSTA
jgi:protoporphyrin/coproporphyrin ferrochelatase